MSRNNDLWNLSWSLWYIIFCVARDARFSPATNANAALRRLISFHCVLFDDFFPLNWKLWPFLGVLPPWVPRQQSISWIRKMTVKHSWFEKVLEVQFALRRVALTFVLKRNGRGRSLFCKWTMSDNFLPFLHIKTAFITKSWFHRKYLEEVHNFLTKWFGNR